MHWIAMVTLACGLSSAVRAQSTRMTPDQFRYAFNLALRNRGLTMQLGSWRPDSRGSLAVTAVVTRDIRLIAQQDRAQRLSSVLLVMNSSGTLESVAEIIATIAATTHAASPQLTLDDREALFGELGFFDEAWSKRGLDGIAVRGGLTYRAIHPGADTLVVVVVSWEAEPEPPNPLCL